MLWAPCHTAGRPAKLRGQGASKLALGDAEASAGGRRRKERLDPGDGVQNGVRWMRRELGSGHRPPCECEGPDDNQAEDLTLCLSQLDQEGEPRSERRGCGTGRSFC